MTNSLEIFLAPSSWSQLSSCSTEDRPYINNSVRRYEDQINFSGLARKVSRGIVKVTGADLWTRNGRLGFLVSYLNQLAGMRHLAFDDLAPGVRDNFLGQYGFTSADWDKIRSAETFDPGNGAQYLDPTKIEQPLSQRLMMAIREQGSYAFHEPDARTLAIMTSHEPAGTAYGETIRSMAQYKQFAMERMTTHLMRALVDGPIENRIGRGLAFALLSTAAGAVSLQAASVVSGKDPMDMTNPRFWTEAFARGGAGGVYGDILAAGLRGDRTGVDLVAQLAGPVPGVFGDAASLAAAPYRYASGESKQTFGHQAFAMGRRWGPSTWYTKLATDRLLWDKMQVLLDPNYRQSFSRAEQSARKQGQGFWWGPGESAPERAPNLSTATGQ